MAAFPSWVDGAGCAEVNGGASGSGLMAWKYFLRGERGGKAGGGVAESIGNFERVPGRTIRRSFAIRYGKSNNTLSATFFW
jgi:hypothetical protein